MSLLAALGFSTAGTRTDSPETDPIRPAQPGQGRCQMLWRSTAWLLGAILLMSGCGGDSDNSADDDAQSAPPASVPASTTTSVPASTTTSAPANPTTTTTPANTTTTPPASSTTTTTNTTPTNTTTTTTAGLPTNTTTSTPELHEEAPLLFDLVVADGEWYAGAEGDPLRATVRNGPGDSYDEAAMITVPRLVIEGTGAVRTDDRGVGWRELLLGLERTGWVEADRLEINFAAQTSYFDDPCATEGAPEGPAPISGASGVSDSEARADHVAQMWHLIGPGCDRLHIALGTAWDYDSSGPLAAGVPDDLGVEAFGTWARITIPGLDSARADAAAEQSWNLTSIVARSTDGTVIIDVYAPRPSLFAARALRDPARLLVDAIPAAGNGNGSPPPATPQLHASQSSFVAWPGGLDAQSPTEVALPLTVRGYSRWFEAAGSVEIQHADRTPSTATVTGPQVFNPGTGSKWGLTATDWLEAWGTFEFTIDNLEPGEYRLLVGEYPPIDDSYFVGVTIPLGVLAP